MNSNRRISRTSIVFLAIELCFAVLIVRLFLVQFLHSEKLRDRSDKQRHAQISSKTTRGKILDRHQSVFAINRDLVSVYADPKIIKSDLSGIARQLSPILETSERELLTKLSRRERRFVWLKRNLAYDSLSEIRPITKGIRGVGYKIHGKRFYAKDERACHIIGHTNYANEGVDGIERQYEAYLLDETSNPSGSNSSKERRIPTDGKRRPIDPPLLYQDMHDYGHSIVLTIDEYIQYITETALVEGCHRWKAKKGCAIVMHSKTGEILAMANYPRYDLNRYSKTQESAKRNLAIWMQYEPGSVFKIITAAAALNEKVVTPDSREYCEMGEYLLPNGHTLHDVAPNGWLTLSEIIQKSSNIGITKVAKYLGKGRLQRYVRRFGCGTKTGIDLPYEQKGNLSIFNRWDDYSMASVPFGQGISVTPIQMLNALNVIATKGVLLQPYITQTILSADDQVIEQFYLKPVRRVISPETARQMTTMLVSVTETGGGRNAKVEGYQVAGKTGTAQKAVGRRGYVKGKEVTTFAGFLPADDPQISIIVVVDESVGTPFSNQVTAPIFQKIADQTMRYLNQKDIFAQRLSESASTN